MRDFIIFFEEKEGTSPLVRLLDNFRGISVVHQTENRGWEPFDRHNCGAMPLGSLRECLGIIYGERPLDLERLNRIYTRTSTLPLADPGEAPEALGFKMRFRPPVETFGPLQPLMRYGRLARLLRYCHYAGFRRFILGLLAACGITVFLTVRQDLLRWGLSKYHGDGTGRPGHLQFKLAAGEIDRKEIRSIRVDCHRLAGIIASCRKAHRRKRRLLDRLRRSGIRARPLLYERFLRDKPRYFRELGRALDTDVSAEDVDEALNAGAYFEKVHSNDISSFVENHEEVLERFGDEYDSWS